MIEGLTAYDLLRRVRPISVRSPGRAHHAHSCFVGAGLPGVWMHRVPLDATRLARPRLT